MKRYIHHPVLWRTLLSLFITVLGALSTLKAAEPGTWSVGGGAGYTIPVGGLSDWFKPALSYNITAGKQHTDAWHLAGMLSYTNYQDENLSGYAAGKVNLSLEHAGILLNAKYSLKKLGSLQAYWNVGGGLYYWKGIRGRVEPDVNMEPVIPLIEERVLEEWNWGFRSGPGIAVSLLGRFSLDITSYYRFIVGDLWPTLQPHIELEGVSGFQSVNLELELKYFFR